MHVIEGIVEPGDQRGRTLGFPTANIPITASPDTDGVWASLVEIGPGTLPLLRCRSEGVGRFTHMKVIGFSKHTFWTSI